MTQKIIISSILVLLILGGLLWSQGLNNADAGTVSTNNLEITMYRSEGCGCCTKWGDYLKSNGFTVNDHPVENIIEIKTENNIPMDISSCHTALIDGYVVEGHVPADDIRRMISEQPEAIGLAVPDMPMGSPGMEGFRTDPYNVILFDDAGKKSIYAQYQ